MKSTLLVVLPLTLLLGGCSSSGDDPGDAAGAAGQAQAGQAGQAGNGGAGQAGNAGQAGQGGAGSNGGKGGQGGAGQAGQAGGGGAGQAGAAGQAGGGGAGQAGAAGQAGGGGAGQAGAAGQSGQGGVSGTFGLNDVSILFPLPEASADGLYRATDVASAGALLPLATFAAVGTIARVGCNVGVGCEMAEPVAETYPRLRVVGVRFDPCFPGEGTPLPACRRQIRLVVQPVEGASFDDAAMHVFYDIPPEEFDATMAALASISSGTDKGLPLGVHPLLAKEGTKGAFATKLRELLFSRIGASRITRVTAMELQQIAGKWSFRGFDFDAKGNATPIGIAGTASTSQSIAGFGSVAFSGPADPVLVTDAPFSLLWDPDKATAAPAAEQKAAYDDAFVIENPTKRNVEQESCVSCHTAMPARAWAVKNLGFSQTGNPNAYTSKLDLSVTAKPDVASSTNMFRAFGYRGQDVGISQRAVNETAAVVTTLNKVGQP